MSSPSVVADPLYVVLGEEELLVERAVWAAVGAARAADAEAELRRIKVSELTPPELDEMLSPSLFAEGRVVVLEAAQEAGKEIAEAVLAHARQPAEGVVLVVTHTGGGRSKPAKELPGALRKLGARVAECAKITKPADREAFVREEVRREGGRINAGGLSALIESVGTDLRELSSAASQLVADAGGTIDEEAVRRYHRGRAEVTGGAATFTLARACPAARHEAVGGLAPIKGGQPPNVQATPRVLASGIDVAATVTVGASLVFAGAMLLIVRRRPRGRHRMHTMF